MSETDEKEKNPPKEKFNLGVAGIAAGLVATLTMSWLGSFLGAFGTLIGAGLTSVVSAIITALAKHTFERTGHVVKSTVAKGQVVIPLKKPPITRKVVFIAAGSAVGVFGLVMGFNTAIEAVAHKPVAAIVQGKKGHGTTLGGGQVSPAPSTPVPTATGHHRTGTPEPTNRIESTEQPTTEPTPAPSQQQTYGPSTPSAPPTVVPNQSQAPPEPVQPIPGAS